MRTKTAAQKEILRESESSLLRSHERDVARCRERLETHAELGQLPPAPERRYRFWPEGNGAAAEVTRKRKIK